MNKLLPVRLCFLPLLLLSACASAPVNIHYYALNNVPLQTAPGKSADELAAQPLVILAPVKLADFLNTGALVMQLQSHQLQLSSQHRWADDLPSAIGRNVLLKLAAQLPDYRFEQAVLPWQRQAERRIELSFEQFQVSAQRDTLCAGTFWLFDRESRLLAKQPFVIRQALTADGYDHAVAMLDRSLSELVTLLAGQLQANAVQ